MMKVTRPVQDLEVNTQTKSVLISAFIEFQAKQVAATLTDTKKIRQLQQAQKMNDTGCDPWDQCASFKKRTDSEDPHYIYKINKAEFGTDPSYVFLFSTFMAKMALEMDASVAKEETPLQYEDIYFDGVHRRVKKHVALAAWVYHPAMRKVLRLATMYCPSEDKECIEIYWELFNEVLRNVLGDKNYFFLPKGFMFDENAANFNGLEAVFGEEIRSRAFSCKWHFMRNVTKHSVKLPSDQQQKFKDICENLTTCSTVARYKALQSELSAIADEVPELRHFVDWWEARRYHIVGAFRQSGHAGLNLAEVGNSAWSSSHRMAIIDAVKEDVVEMLYQESEIQKFFSNKGRSSGRGPTTAAQTKKLRVQQSLRTQEIIENFDTIVHDIASEREGNSAGRNRVFTPRAGAGHKPGSRKKGVEGSWKRVDTPRKVPHRMSMPTPPAKKQRRAARAARSTAVDILTRQVRDMSTSSPSERKRKSVSFAAPAVPEEDLPTPKKRLFKSSSSSSSAPDPTDARALAMEVLQSDAHEEDRRPPSCVQPAGSPPKKEKVVVDILTGRVKKCHGCGKEISLKLQPFPYDMIFRSKGHRHWIHPDGSKRTNYSNVFFHLDFNCVKEKVDSKLEDIAVEDNVFTRLKKSQLNALHKLGYLQLLLANQC